VLINTGTLGKSYIFPSPVVFFAVNETRRIFLSPSISKASRHVFSEKNETRLDAFEMKGLRKILRVSWTAKKTNEWVLNKAGVKRELLDTVKAGKLAYYGHTMRKQNQPRKR